MAILLDISTSPPLSCVFLRVDSGIRNDAPFISITSSMLKPLSSSTMSPGSKLFVKFEFTVSCLSLVLPPHPSEIKEIDPCGVIAIKYLTVLLCLLDSALGFLDLLWPSVTLMLEGQTQWCPGRKFAGYIQKARDEIIRLMIEIGKEMQKKFENGRGEEIRSKKYGNSNLELEGLLWKKKRNACKLGSTRNS